MFSITYLRWKLHNSLIKIKIFEKSSSAFTVRKCNRKVNNIWFSKARTIWFENFVYRKKTAGRENIIRVSVTLSVSTDFVSIRFQCYQRVAIIILYIYYLLADYVSWLHLINMLYDSSSLKKSKIKIMKLNVK